MRKVNDKTDVLETRGRYHLQAQKKRHWGKEITHILILEL